ncbi:unnamed protein product [Rhizoctonia solani]|uniref:Secreted protein n=1 Tax=Rhizoctonia solani TaxID=456999 RepID=A0A8H3E1K5_9AGAM|nr:unnamed protein product [Rhizoctonia solani]
MLRDYIFRLFAITFMLSAVVWGAPVEASKSLVTRSGGTCFIGCTTGTKIFETLTGLNGSLHSKLAELDDCYTTGTDPTNVMNNITALFDGASTRMSDLPGDLTGQLNGKGPDILNLWIDILTALVKHSAQWNNESSLNARGISGDIFAALYEQITTAVASAQAMLMDALGNLQNLGSQLLDASKPHLEQLQEQLVGHGLNVLGSISETINNLLGSIMGGRLNH